MLLIAAVATILPAVAVADVLVTGTADFTGSSAAPVFEFSPGPNYAAAHASGLFSWPATSEASHPGTMGDGDLQGITNQTVSLLNVMKITFTTSGYFYLNMTDEWAAPGNIIVTSSLQSGSLAGLGTALDSTVPVTVFQGAVTPSTTLYICFYLPGGTYSTSNHFELTGTLIDS